MRGRARLALALAAAAGLSAAASTIAGAVCPEPPELRPVSIRLPHVAAHLREKQAIKIVALGGASTWGAAAGNPQLAYPQRLQLALAARYPDAAVTVVNKGVPRQSARQMVDRFAADVFPERPVLVIWEVGISDAVRGIEIDDFAMALQAGIDQLKNRAIDIVLVDMQFSRKAAAVIDFDRYLETIHRIGELNDAYVFPRFAMMRYWSEQHVFDFDEVAANERAQLAARVYDCVGRALADAIATATATAAQ